MSVLVHRSLLLVKSAEQYIHAKSYSQSGGEATLAITVTSGYIPNSPLSGNFYHNRKILWLELMQAMQNGSGRASGTPSFCDDFGDGTSDMLYLHVSL